jgi:hypothetical protein
MRARAIYVQARSEVLLIFVRVEKVESIDRSEGHRS